MSTTNGMWLRGRPRLHRPSHQTLQCPKGAWLGLEARPDYVLLDHLLIS